MTLTASAPDTTATSDAIAGAETAALAGLRQQALARLRELESHESPSPSLWAWELAGGDETLAAPLADLIAQDHARLHGEA